MQAQAAESSGYAGQCCCFLNYALKQTRKRFFKSFLTRNELVDSPGA